MYRFAAASLAVALAACGASHEDPPPPPDLGSSTREVAGAPTKVERYYSIRPDPRACPSPACGGWFLGELNAGSAAEQYVSELDFSPSGLEQKQLDLVRQTPPARVILSGALGPAAQNTRELLVTAAFLGMPNVTPSVDTVYSVTVLPLDCASCPTLRANLLNTQKVESAHTLSVKRAARPFVQVDWLEGRVLGHAALVSAAVSSPPALAATNVPPQRVIDASQVWVKLPEVRACPAVKPAPCVNDTLVSTFSRDAERCLMPGACVKPGPCLLYFPACESGYRLVSWPSAPNGCDAFACDPEFVSP